MSRIKERENYAEIGTYLHIDEGRARVKSYTSVNEPIRTDNAEITKKIGKVRVRMIIEEDKSVNRDGSFYEKSIDTIQERDNEEHETRKTRESKVQEDPDVNTQEPEKRYDAVSVLKNFVDNIAADNRVQWAAIIGTLMIVTAITIILLTR